MDELVKTTEKKEVEEEFSFKKFFVPFTTLKAIHWIVIIGLVLYFKIFFNGIAWDDESFIFYNPQIYHFDLIRLFGGNLFNNPPYYRPIPAVYFSFLFTLFNNEYFFYHFFQLLLHIVDTAFLFILFKKFIKIPMAFFLSLIFLIHPINVESVAYIAASQSEIFFFFGILALLLSFSEHLTFKRIFFINCLLLLGLLTKEVAVLFLLAIYLYRFLYKKEISFSLVGASLATIIVYIIIRFIAIGFNSEGYLQSPISNLSFFLRLLNIPMILFYYIKSFFFPTTFAIDQIWTITSINNQNFFFPFFIDVIFYGTILIVGFYFLRRNKKEVKPFLFFTLWYLTGIGMLLQIFPLDMTVADRWFYFPMVGLLGIGGLLLQQIPLKKYSIHFSVVCVIILLLLSYKTFTRLADWHDALTLYNHDLKVYNNYIIEEAYGIDLGSVGQYQASVIHLEKSIAEDPRESNLSNLANTYQNMNELPKAVFYYQKALQVGVPSNAGKEDFEDTFINYVKALFRLHEYKEAKQVVAEGITHFPNSPLLWSEKLQIDEALGDKNAVINDETQLNISEQKQ